MRSSWPDISTKIIEKVPSDTFVYFGSHLLSGKPSSIHVHRTRIAILIPSQTNLGQNLLPTNWFGNPYLEFQPTKLLEITAPRGKLKRYRQSFALNYSWHASEYSCFCFSGSFFIFRLLCIFSNALRTIYLVTNAYLQDLVLYFERGLLKT